MNCIVCNKEIARGKRYQGNKYKNLNFCSDNCFKKYCEIKSKPKPLINFKPEKGTKRRLFTDFIQEWSGDKCNWAFIMKQAKDIQEEYELDWYTMYLVCKYAKVYEEVEWDNKYGLGQIFPRYILPCQELIENINKNKNIEIVEDPVQTIRKKKKINYKINF